MSSTGLDAKSICDIIDACGKNGVADLKIGDVEISFFVKRDFEDRVALNDMAAMAMDPLQTNFLDPYASQASGQSEVKRRDPVDQELLDDMKASQRMMDDPLGHEQDVINQLLRGQ